jgi:hypothetical protein
MLELGLHAQQALGEKAKLQGQPTLASYGIYPATNEAELQTVLVNTNA